MKFLEMGGYGYYVWPAIAVTFLVMVVLWVMSSRTLRGREAELKLLEAAEARTEGERAIDET